MGAGGVPILGGMFNAAGAQMEAQQKSRALNSEAATSRQNAILAREQGEFDAERQQVIANQREGETIAAYGAAGIEQSSVSALEVLRQSVANAELDRRNILHGSDLRAMRFESDARAARAGAKSAKQVGNFNAYASLFGGAARSASYADYSSRGGGTE